MSPTSKDHYRVLILGGGTAGITVAARLRRRLKGAAYDVGIVEPSSKHYYQPLWTLVGAGVFPKRLSERSESAFIPEGADWIRDSVAELLPAQNAVRTASGRELTYDFLIVALGIQIDWDRIPGLSEGLGRDGLCSNYSYKYVDYTWECVRTFQGGTALFTMPNTPIKCGGAPQKIMYLADDRFRRAGVRDRTNVIFATAQPTLFAVERYCKTLRKVVHRKGIDARFQQNLVALRPAAKQAVFQDLSGGESVVEYDMAHVTPPMSAPDVIKRSPLANTAGWVDIDHFTLQHPRFANVFPIGDCSGLPTSKTGAAIRKQAPVLVQNLLAAMNGEPLPARYDGYTSCPIVTGYGRLILAEFGYEGQPQETFPFDQSKERLSMYLLKAYGLPRLYWDGMLRGRA